MASASAASRRPPRASHPSRVARLRATAPRPPSRMPMTTPTPSSRSALSSSKDTLSLTWPSWLAATAMETVTMGVAMPSLRPLSTLSARRSRIGIRSSLMTCKLNAASVGASDAPRNSASPQGRSKSSPAMTAPSTTLRGKPMPRRRTGRVVSARSLLTLTRAASANSSSASVTSAMTWTDDASMSTGSGPQSALPRRYPAAANTSGPVTFRRARAPDSTAQAKTSTARAASVSTFMSVLPVRASVTVVRDLERATGSGCSS